MTPKGKQRIGTAAVWVLRIAAGVVFTVSGAAKMIDPYGFIYKINDYLAAWNLTISPGFVIFAAALLSASEFLIGFTLATGSMRRTSAWLASALMLFMLPLTLYLAIENPVSDCGCFGDFLIISNWATFWKNVALTAALVFLCIKNRTVEGLFTPMSQWLQITVAAIWVAIIGLIGYHEQPLIDFRPYPAGSTLIQEADTEGIIYRYSMADGTIRDFTANSLPDDDEDLTFIGRIDPEEYAPESAFAIFDDQGEDVTYDVVGATPRQLIMLVPDIEAAGISDTYTANELAGLICSEEMEDSPEAFVAVVHSPSKNALEEWLDMSMADYPIYTAEDRAIKTVARGKMALLYLENDTIRWKRTLSSIDPEVIDQPGFTLESLDTNGPEIFGRLTFLFVAVETIIMLLGRGATFSRLTFLRSRKARKAAKK